VNRGKIFAPLKGLVKGCKRARRWPRLGEILGDAIVFETRGKEPVASKIVAKMGLRKFFGGIK